MAYRRLLALFLLGCGLPALSLAAEFREGVHYERILAPVPTESSEGIEVREMFWYGCPHCYQFEPKIREWLAQKPEDVNFVRMPATLRKSWVNHAKAYFVAEALGVLEKVHEAMFERIHRDNEPTDSEDALAAFFASHGVEEAKFRQTFNSFGIQARVQQADRRARAYQASGVPVMIVNGKYRVSAHKDVFAVIHHLVDLERAAQTAQGN